MKLAFMLNEIKFAAKAIQSFPQLIALIGYAAVQMKQPAETSVWKQRFDWTLERVFASLLNSLKCI